MMSDGVCDWVGATTTADATTSTEEVTTSTEEVTTSTEAATTTQAATTTTTTTAAPYSDEITFDADYNTIVAPNKAQFLDDCTQSLAPATCVDARSGSVIVTIEASSQAHIDSAVSTAGTSGISLSSGQVL